jgi:hypothetical protein
MARLFERICIGKIPAARHPPGSGGASYVARRSWDNVTKVIVPD